MSFYAKPWTQISGYEIATRYAFQTERLADADMYGGYYGGPPCDCGECGDLPLDEGDLDLDDRYATGEVGAGW